MRGLLYAEIDVEWPEPAVYQEVARAWLDGGFTALAGGHRRALETGPKLPPEAMRSTIPCGPPHAAWGFVSTARHDGRQLRRSARVICPRSMSWFLKQLADPPRTATIDLSVLDERGYPGTSVLRLKSTGRRPRTGPRPSIGRCCRARFPRGIWWTLRGRRS
ncbi:hypothetical protein [Streptomyces sp. NPDC089795]|uniref:hypothetical protein n=1 Tax=Streptomyces sp. NPDC089795 TaxID=3155297 RepID=UPI0034492DE1